MEESEILPSTFDDDCIIVCNNNITFPFDPFLSPSNNYNVEVVELIVSDPLSVNIHDIVSLYEQTLPIVSTFNSSFVKNSSDLTYLVKANEQNFLEYDIANEALDCECLISSKYELAIDTNYTNIDFEMTDQSISNTSNFQSLYKRDLNMSTYPPLQAESAYVMQPKVLLETLVNNNATNGNQQKRGTKTSLCENKARPFKKTSKTAPDKNIKQNEINKLFKVKRSKLNSYEYKKSDAKENSTNSLVFLNFIQKVESLVSDYCQEKGENLEGSFLPINDLKYLHELAAILKNQDLFHCCPVERLEAFLLYLHKIVLNGSEVTNFQEKKSFAKVLSSLLAASTILFVMTSSKVPKNVFIEEVIEDMIKLVEFHISNTIIPKFELDPKLKSSGAKSKALKIKKEKDFVKVYNKLHEIFSQLTQLIETQAVNESLALKLVSLSINLFFIGHIDELQLNAITLVSKIFSRNLSLCPLILEEILNSYSKLPSNKISHSLYHIDSKESIQMLSALVLQLIQSFIKLPKINVFQNEQGLSNSETLIVTSYEQAATTGLNFICHLFNKCATKTSDIDFRPIFENFIHDILTVLFRPEWPIAQLMLNLAGNVFIDTIFKLNADITLRLSALEFMGKIAAALLKEYQDDNALNQSIDYIIKKIAQNMNETEENKKAYLSQPLLVILQNILFNYLEASINNDYLKYTSKDFYIALWYYYEHNINSKTTDRKLEEMQMKDDSNKPNIKKTKKDSKSNFNSTKDSLKYFIQLIEQPFISNKYSLFPFDNKDARLIAKILAFKQHFAISFDLYLSKILRALNEPIVSMRTRGLKCLSQVIELNPYILLREGIQQCVNGRLLDHSINVREAAIDLIGKYVINVPDISQKYFEVLLDRILDTGISVRKRVLKILKNLCLQQPYFPFMSEICSNVVKRVEDEESIVKLVEDLFLHVCFSPEKVNKEAILKKTKLIISIISSHKNTGIDILEQLLKSLLKNESNSQNVLKACQQIIDCLIEMLLQVENSLDNEHTLAVMSSLYLFCKICPTFIQVHASTIHSYLSMTCASKGHCQTLFFSIRCLNLILPYLVHPSDNLLAQVEEDLIKIILREGMLIIPSCISCLSIVNQQTKNYQLVEECFKKFASILFAFYKEYEANNNTELLAQKQPALLRSLFIVGLFCCHFDFNLCEYSIFKDGNFKNMLYRCMLFFIKHKNEEIKHKALIGIGYMMVRYSLWMIKEEISQYYNFILTEENVSNSLKCQVLTNLSIYFKDRKNKITISDINSKNGNLKEIGDKDSEIISVITQTYLKSILVNVLNPCIEISKSAFQLCQDIFEHGLIHPLQIMEYLICLSSNDLVYFRSQSEVLIKEIEKKYPGFLHIKAQTGTHLSFKMNKELCTSHSWLRGTFISESNVGRLSFLYNEMRKNNQNRRGYIFSLLKLFDENSTCSLQKLLYIADNLAFFPYQLLDELLFVLYHSNTIVSRVGMSSYESLHSIIYGYSSNENENNDSDDLQTIIDKFKNFPQESLMIIKNVIVRSQSCLLLLLLNNFLQTLYSISDEKIQTYSPNDTLKLHDRPLKKNCTIFFEPHIVAEFLNKEVIDDPIYLRNFFLTFKQLFLKSNLDLCLSPNDNQIESSKNRANYESKLNDEPSKTNSNTNESSKKQYPCKRKKAPAKINSNKRKSKNK